MQENDKLKKSSKGLFEKLINNFISFCRKFRPKNAGAGSNRLKQLSFDSLKLLGGHQRKIDDINKDASSIVKEHLHNVTGLLEFIERRGTRVIRCKHADRLLIFLGEIEGFTPPLTGLKCKLLILGLKLIGGWNEPIPSQTPPMFIFGSKEPPMGYMVHQIHHWLSFNNGLPGYTEETMNNFKRIFDPTFGVEDVKKMSKEEIIALREAIARDQEALDFVQKMAQEIFKPQDILKGIKDGDKKNI